MKNSYILRLLHNWLIAVCETLEEAKLCQKSWASWILLVEHRWKWTTHQAPKWELIMQCKDSLTIPILVRVRHWHYKEAEIAEEFGADIIVESFKEDESIQNQINPEEIWIPIIKEYLSAESVNSSPYSWHNILLLWDYWWWKIWKLLSQLEQVDISNKWQIFVWWWISSPADIILLKNAWWCSFFVWTALFYYNTLEFISEFIDLID